MTLPTLCICIPTYNRATKLRLQLTRILSIALSYNNPKLLSFYISDNGSTDNTKQVITEFAKRYLNSGLQFKYHSHARNIGFDLNLYSCYKSISVDYIWFLSDDDLPHSDCINNIMLNLQNSPNVAYHNFYQQPYLFDNPYVADKFISSLTIADSVSLSKILLWPKLSSFVVKKYTIPPDFYNKNIPFAHVAIALYIICTHGRLIFSSKFLASVQYDYLDNIDFPPYVGNLFIEFLTLFAPYLPSQDYHDDLHHICSKTINSKFNSSISHLTQCHLAGLRISPTLKCELKSNIFHSLRLRPSLALKPLFLSYILSYIYYIPPFNLLVRFRKFRRHYHTKRLIQEFLDS